MDDPSDIVEISDNELDFQEPIEVITRKRKYNSYVKEDDSEEEDLIATTCSICQSYWTNSGTHSIVNLKCGHVYGRSCIDNYIKEMNSLCSYAACPKCRHPVTRSDLRRIWPSKLIPETDQELKPLKLELEESKKLLNELCQQQISLKDEIASYKHELENLNPQTELLELIKQTQSQPSQASQNRFKLQEALSFPNEIYNVIDLNPTLDMAVASTVNLINHKVGLRKINLFDPKITEFIAIDHKSTIRDIRHSTKEPLALTTGDDRTLKLTSMKNNIVILSYSLDLPSQACSFDEKNTNILYCGLSSGSLMVYDIRNTKRHLHRLNKPVNASPILSIVSHCDSIVCSDNTGYYNWFLDQEQEYKCNELYLSLGEIPSYSTDFKSGLFLTSFSKDDTTRFSVSHLEKCDSPYINEDDKLVENYSMLLDWNFSGVNDNHLPVNRNTLFQRDGDTFVCYYDDDQVKIRNKVTEVQALPKTNGVLDIQHTAIDNNEFLITLTESTIRSYIYPQ